MLIHVHVLATHHRALGVNHRQVVEHDISVVNARVLQTIIIMSIASCCNNSDECTDVSVEQRPFAGGLWHHAQRRFRRSGLSH